LRLSGRHGAEIIRLLEAARPGDLEVIGDTPLLWAELRWAARSEAVVHLDDLLLRRVRLGLLLPAGGIQIIDRIRLVAQPELGWDDRRWQVEEECYRTLWQSSYGLSASC
jgi:glycerol-3-phosphate dehydrogenase